MIKFVLRRNLKYLLQLIIWNFIRDLEVFLIKYLFNFGNSLLFTTIMFIAEFFSGFIVYKYQKSFFLLNKFNDNNLNNVKTANGLGLIQNTFTYKLIPLDNYYKIYFLIFIVSISDFVQFMIRTNLIGKFINISVSLQSRLGANITIFATFYYVYALRLPIFKHQKFSLSIFGFCIIIIIIFEFIFQKINIFLSYGDLILVISIITLNTYISSVIDSIEKYLFEYNFINPFKALLFEGLFGFILTLLFFSMPQYLKDVAKVYNDNSGGRFTLFIFLLFIYLILCGGRNVFRVISIKLYTPMARAFSDYFLNPLYLLFCFVVENDFSPDDESKRVLFFLINLILSIIITFCGSVFNEFIVLFCCGLELNTYDQISKRAKIKQDIYLTEMADTESIV